MRDIPPHDLLTAGFPCQPFSPAGKKLGIHDSTNGTLFRCIVNILSHHQPRYFVLENVRRMLSMQDGWHFRVILSELSALNYSIEWRVINSISFGIPQYRQRVFLVGERFDVKPTSLAPKLVIDHRDDFFWSDNISLKDFSALAKNSRKFDLWGMACSEKFISKDETDDLNLLPKKALYEILEENEDVDPTYDYTENIKQRIRKSNYVNKFHNGVKILYNQNGGARFGYSIFGTDGYSSTLTASTSRHYERYKVGDTYRRLTNVEYARLMGFPDDWCRVLKLYDQHFAFGNAVTPSCGGCPG